MSRAAVTAPTQHLADAPVEPPCAGRRVADRYELEQPIGRGGMGVVLRAHDHVLDRKVALKRSREREHDGPYGRRLHREARIAARVAHRAIVQVHDLVRDDGVDHLVMELVEGPSLMGLHERGRIEPGEAIRVLLELAAGLEAIHDRGAIHLDLKLENVLLTGDGQPKITDFGIARAARELDVDGESLTHLVGTPRVMSPEQIQGDPVDARSDLYSLGVLAYELLAGASPFAGASEMQTLTRVLGEDPPRLDDVVVACPPELARLVADLLEKSPSLRPQSALEVQVRLWAMAGALP